MRRYTNRDRDYMALIQSWRWRKLRATHMAAHPLCERCIENERLTPATVVHHIKPIESAYGLAEKTRLAFDEDNLMSLCHGCHDAVHNAMKKNSKEQQRERKDERVRGFTAMFFGSTPGG